MKKVFLTLAVVAVAALAMTSCSDKEQCWAVRSQATIEEGGLTLDIDETVYVWGSRDDIKEQIKEAKEEAKEEGATGVKITYKKAKADDATACAKLNAEDLLGE